MDGWTRAVARGPRGGDEPRASSGIGSCANGPYALWKWDGFAGGAPVKGMDLTGFRAGSAPEAFVPYPSTTDPQILHDEGSFRISGSDCKEASANSQFFTDRILVSVR